jgi:predicted HicB family RNase H-like nuclease
MSEAGHGLHYRGFTARIYYDEEEAQVLGHVPTTKGGIDFRCSSLGAVEQELHRVVDDHLRRHPDAEPIKPKH